MTKFSKAYKVQAVKKYIQTGQSANQVAHEFGLQTYDLLMLIAAYQVHGSKIIYDPPQITAEFRIRLTLWAIEHNSYVEVARQFGYTHIPTILKWKKIYI
ncbi:transposase, partial [Leuconostocaceae bacterium ESL0958]|nr:transposase [Leuconostocaceae bacterium ESL0958]